MHPLNIKSRRLHWRYVPYAGFLLFSLLMTIVRFIVMPSVATGIHLLWFVAQFVLLTLLWLMIGMVAKFLDKKLSYNDRFSRRVFFQVTVTLAILVPPILTTYLLVKPHLPAFFSTQFAALSVILLIVLIVLMNVGYAAGTFFINWQNSQKDKARVEEEKRNAEMQLLLVKQRQAEIEMKALRAQMNPHFIFNSLNSINKYILKSDHIHASRYLTRFAKLIRLILDNSNSREVTLSDELEALKLYIEMEALRFTNKFSYEIKINENVTVDTLQVPPLMIQPYVENAIWHGLLHKESEGHLCISLSKIDDTMLECIIEDNGIGRTRARELKSKSATVNKSLGMKLTEERINILNQYTLLNASIQIIDLVNDANEATGTKVILTIPV